MLIAVFMKNTYDIPCAYLSRRASRPPPGFLRNMGGRMGKNGFCRFFAKTSRAFVCPVQLLLVLLAFGNVCAFAADALQLSGFGTLGYTSDNRSDMAPARDISYRPRNGSATGASWLPDSRLGVQLEYRASPTVDLVGQVVLRDHFKADFANSTELAYIAIKTLPDVDVRVGRINFDAFLMSDHRNVGYAYQWVRPPTAFYGWIPIFSVDGADAAYTIHRENARWRIKLQAANSRLSVPIVNGYEFRANNLFAASVSRQSDFWRLKAAYSQFTVGSEVPAFAPLHQGLDAVAAAAIPQVSAEAADLRKNLAFAGAKITYATLGAAYDDGVWLAQSELGRTTSTADVIPHARMAYVSIGRRIGDWTPNILLSTSRPINSVRSAASNWGAFNATLRDPALFTVNTTRIEQDTLSIGARWDFSRQAALKLQWERTVIKPSGYGLWWRDLAINSQTSLVNQLSATVDFTF